LVALAPTARAQEAAPAASTSASPAAKRKFQVGLSFLQMSLGKHTSEGGGMRTEADAAYAPAFAVSAGYTVISGLTLGVAWQQIFNVKAKELDNGGSPVVSKERDLMVRVAYAYPLADTIEIYAEALPGYSSISQADSESSTGFVLAVGAGLAMDLGDRMFVNLGGGYQVGFQTLPASGNDLRTKYVRIALGVGMRF
jgi:opacity protein-like surface antigen